MTPQPTEKPAKPKVGLTRVELLNTLIERYEYQSYLEIGVRSPELYFNSIRVMKKIGIDPGLPAPRPPSPEPVATVRPEILLQAQAAPAPVPAGNPALLGMSSDTYFMMHHRIKFQLIFINGDHSHEQAGRDIDLAIEHLLPGGTVVVHDVNPLHESWQGAKPGGKTKDNPGGRWMGEAWRAWVEHRTDWRSATVIVRGEVDAPNDCGIIQPGNPKLPLILSMAMPDSYEEFAAHRDHWLNLMSWKEIQRKL